MAVHAHAVSACGGHISETPEKGEESILCEGAYQSWLHIRCAGLSSAVFAAVSTSSEPFFCFACHISSQAKEIANLKSNVSTLTSELSSLKSGLNSVRVSLLSPSASAPVSSVNSQVSHSSQVPSPPVHHPSTSPVRRSSERKYKIIIFGIS